MSKTEPNVRHVNFIIIGAGPFGLSMSSYAKYHDMDYLVLGKPMSFWKEHMPAGMYLRVVTGISTRRVSIR